MWRCNCCGRIFNSYQAAERHADDEHNGARIDTVIDPDRKAS